MTEQQQSQPSTQLARLSPRTRYFMKIWSEVEAVCAATMKKKPGHKDDRLQALRNRWVMNPDDPSLPIVVEVTFAPGPDSTYLETQLWAPDHETGHMIQVRARPFMMIDGKGGVLSLLHEEEFVDHDGAEVKDLIPKTHTCIVLFEPRVPYYRVVPLGLALKESIDVWNNIGAQKRELATEADLAKIEADWPTIEHLPHAWLDEGGQELVFQPTCFEPTAPIKEGMSEKDIEEIPSYYGTIFGQKVVDATKGKRIPRRHRKDGSDAFFIPQRFKVVGLTLNSIQVEFMGPADTTKLRRGVLSFEKVTVDGFRALGLTKLTVDPKKYKQHGMFLALHAPCDESNPLYVYARESEWIEEGAAASREILRKLSERALWFIGREMDEVVSQLSAQLTTKMLPSLWEVVGDRTFHEVWNRTGGEDKTTEVVSELIDGPFDWKSWLCREMRMRMLEQLAQKDGVKTPPEAPVQEVPVEAAAEKVAEEVTEEPKAPKKRASRAKKNDQDGASAPA